MGMLERVQIEKEGFDVQIGDIVVLSGIPPNREGISRYLILSDNLLYSFSYRRISKNNVTTSEFYKYATSARLWRFEIFREKRKEI
jgi:hypothetical protein